MFLCSAASARRWASTWRVEGCSAIDLGAIAARAALETTGVAPGEIDHTIIGNALQTSGDAIYGARHVALKAGVPFDRPRLPSIACAAAAFSRSSPARR